MESPRTSSRPVRRSASPDPPVAWRHVVECAVTMYRGSRPPGPDVRSHSTSGRDVPRRYGLRHRPVELRNAPTLDEPDAVDRLRSGVEETVRRRRVKGDRIARAQLVIVEADRDAERSLQDVAPLLPRVALK